MELFTLFCPKNTQHDTQYPQFEIRRLAFFFILNQVSQSLSPEWAEKTKRFLVLLGTAHSPVKFAKDDSSKSNLFFVPSPETQVTEPYEVVTSCNPIISLVGLDRRP